jgi:hypothetical protein
VFRASSPHINRNKPIKSYHLKSKSGIYDWKRSRYDDDDDDDYDQESGNENEDDDDEVNEPYGASTPQSSSSSSSRSVSRQPLNRRIKQEENEGGNDQDDESTNQATVIPSNLPKTALDHRQTYKRVEAAALDGLSAKKSILKRSYPHVSSSSGLKYGLPKNYFTKPTELEKDHIKNVTLRNQYAHPEKTAEELLQSVVKQLTPFINNEKYHGPTFVSAIDKTKGYALKGTMATDDPVSFISDITQYAISQGWDEHELVSRFQWTISPFARTWYRRYWNDKIISKGTSKTVREVFDAFVTQFATIPSDLFSRRLYLSAIKMKSNETALKYRQRFEAALLQCAATLPKDQQVEYFLQGLPRQQYDIITPYTLETQDLSQLAQTLDSLMIMKQLRRTNNNDMDLEETANDREVGAMQIDHHYLSSSSSISAIDVTPKTPPPTTAPTSLNLSAVMTFIYQMARELGKPLPAATGALQICEQIKGLRGVAELKQSLYAQKPCKYSQCRFPKNHCTFDCNTMIGQFMNEFGFALPRGNPSNRGRGGRGGNRGGANKPYQDREERLYARLTEYIDKKRSASQGESSNKKKKKENAKKEENKPKNE